MQVFRRIKVLTLVTICLLSTLFFACQKDTPNSGVEAATPTPLQQTNEPITIAVVTAVPTEAAPTLLATPSPVPTDTPAPTALETPHMTTVSDPANWSYTWKLMVNGVETDAYTRTDAISFGGGDTYAALPGVLTLRGSNYRTNAAYGTAAITEGKLSSIWSVDTGRLAKSSSGSWTGSGWTGQCLMVQWPDETKQIMNLYDDAKQKDGLIEVIYATMDGNVYFLDAETGKATRDKLVVGIPFKGAGALDPRGWPILYLGTGDSYSPDAKKGRAMAYSLIDYTRLIEVGKDHDSFSLRNWHAYDSSVLVDAETDTLIVPGENGILYTVHLNTKYDPAAGTLTMNPDEIVKQRYDAKRLGPDRDGKYCYGYESSAVTWQNYCYLCDNGGFMRCIDLNSMETIWVADLFDDTNSTPAFEATAAGNFLYVGNTVDRTTSNGKGVSTFFKINAMTGETVWTFTHTVTTDGHITGGCMSSAVLGEGSLSGLVFTGFASSTGEREGIVYALRTSDGSVAWEYKLSTYTWSSPIVLYTDDGTGYLFITDQQGVAVLLRAADGTLVTSLKLSENIEASPCAFGGLIVIGTRNQHILGIRVS